jgi:hypothetical protein
LVPLIFRIGFFLFCWQPLLFHPQVMDGYIISLRASSSIIPPLLEIVARPAALVFCFTRFPAQH